MFRCKCKNGISSPLKSETLLIASHFLPNVTDEKFNEQFVLFIYTSFLYVFFNDTISSAHRGSTYSNDELINEQ